MTERHPIHKRLVPGITISIIGCLSILLIPNVFAQVTNPSSGDTIGTFCSTGVCHTPGGVINAVKPNVTTSVPLASPIGSLKLSQSCVGNNCTTIKSVQQIGKIGIQLSMVCLRELQSNSNSTCLNYNDLKQFDNTNPLYAGLWVANPYEHRLPPKIRNHENFNPNPWAIMVDPNADFTTSAKMIIVDTHFTWTNQNDVSDRGLSMKSYKDRYVSDNCQEARVGPSITLIQDTITYLESGCTTSNMNTTKITYQKEIPFSYDNPYSTLHYQDQIKKVKSTGGLGDCIHKICNYKSPYSKW